MQKRVVINECFGGFSLSEQALKRYRELGGTVEYHRDIERDDPLLIQVVEELGEAANGRCAALKIVEIPSDVEWQIEEYDGLEHVAEKHRIWS